MKIVLLALAIIGLGVRGFFMYQANQVRTAKQALSTRQTIDQIRRGTGGPDAEADAAAQGRGSALQKPAAPAATPVDPAQAAQRQEIEGSIKALHLTTLMPGDPGQVIIDKEPYAEGQEVPLGKGRKAKIVAVQDDGVRLTCNGMTFHLDGPAAPDLVASRPKKK